MVTADGKFSDQRGDEEAEGSKSRISCKQKIEREGERIGGRCTMTSTHKGVQTTHCDRRTRGRDLDGIGRSPERSGSPIQVQAPAEPLAPCSPACQTHHQYPTRSLQRGDNTHPVFDTQIAASTLRNAPANSLLVSIPTASPKPNNEWSVKTVRTPKSGA